MAKSNTICADCGSPKPAVIANRGYLWIEIICWLCYILPGIIYSIWRRVRRREVCSFCGNPSIISIYSARGRQMMSLMNNQHVPKELLKNPPGDTDLKPKTLRAMKKRQNKTTKSNWPKKR